MLADHVPQLWLSRSWTSRSRRPGEAADAYVFVSRSDFEAHVAAGGFLEWAEFVGNLYGTPHPVPPQGRSVLLEIDVQGAQLVRTIFGDQALIVFIDAPSDQELERRLRGRADLNDEAVQRRLARARQERIEVRRIADTVVVNDQVDRVVAELEAMIGNRLVPHGATDSQPDSHASRTESNLK